MPTTYAFDPTGSNPANRILNEVHVITVVNGRDFSFFVPQFAPFFASNINLSFTDTNNTTRNLIEGVDYYLSHHFISASRACSAPIYGSITFINNQVAGVVRVSYNTVGGVWTLSEAAIIDILATSINNPRITSWEQIANLPYAFPVIDHEWDLVDMVGASEVVEGLEGIRDAILENVAGGSSSHSSDKNNPHETTKEQIGLGNVSNFPVATVEQATNGVNNSTYMTPALVRIFVENSSSSGLTSHVNNTSNPHNTTKSQVGLGNVDNYATATNAETVAGVASNLFTTPAGVKAATDVVNTTLTTHVNNTSNPHGTTKAQVGLENVENFSLATNAEAQAGVVTNKYMTPSLTQLAISSLALIPLNNHTSRTDNPHSVTKSQVGLSNVPNLSIATQAEANAGTIDTAFMTPLKTKNAVISYSTEIVATHANATNNPHSVTKTQVGLGNVDNYSTATDAQAQDTTNNTTFMTPLRTHSAVMSYSSTIVSAHANRTDNPHSVTAAQVGSYTITQVDSLLSSKLSVSGTATDSTRFNSLTYAEFIDVIEGMTVNNSTLLQNMEPIELFEVYGSIKETSSKQPDPLAPSASYQYYRVATNIPLSELPDYDVTPTEYSNNKRDGVFIVTGGVSSSALYDPCFIVRISPRNVISYTSAQSAVTWFTESGAFNSATTRNRITIQSMFSSDDDFDVQFGLGESRDISSTLPLEFYVRCPNGHTGFTVSAIESSQTLIDIQYLGTTNPVNVLFYNKN